MIALVIILTSVLVFLLAACGFVIFALLKRLDSANSAMVEAANRTLAMAEATAKAAPRQMDKMMDTLASNTTKMFASIESTVKTVLTPPPIQVIDGAPNQMYRMPTMEEGMERRPVDPTDDLIPDPSRQGPYADMGYYGDDESEGNWTGIPGLADPPMELLVQGLQTAAAGNGSST